MLDDATIAADLKRAHADHGERDLFTEAGERIVGFFLTQTRPLDEMAIDMVGEPVRELRSPTKLAINARITNRKSGDSWLVKAVRGDEHAYIHTLRSA